MDERLDVRLAELWVVGLVVNLAYQLVGLWDDTKVATKVA
jgi:hypothetical protein